MILFRINLSRDDSNKKAMQVFMLTSLMAYALAL